MRLVNNTVLIALCAFVVSSCNKEGCTDPLANNFKKKAEIDDGSCTYDIPEVFVVSEDITVPTTWNAQTVQVCEDIDVSAALTIAPGTTVIMCANGAISVRETGSLNAVGTAIDPIVFKGETASPGYWEGIEIRSNNPNNQFNYVTISDAGSYWFWEFSSVYLNDLAKLGIQNSTISNSEQYGLFAVDNASFTSFSNNTFSNNAIAGLNITVNQLKSLDTETNYNNGNGENFINVRGGEIGTNQTWKKTNTPILIVGNAIISAGLTIESGSTFLMEAEADITVRESGFLTAIGTATEQINIQGRFASAGYWQGIYFRSNNPNNKLNYVNIKDAGSYWFYEFASINVEGRLEIDNCTVSNSNSWAMRAETSTTIMSNGAVQTDASGVTVTNTLTGNGVGPDADCIGGGCTILFE